jgi:hypothetical protein
VYFQFILNLYIAFSRNLELNQVKKTKISFIRFSPKTRRSQIGVNPNFASSGSRLMYSLWNIQKKHYKKLTSENNESGFHCSITLFLKVFCVVSTHLLSFEHFNLWIFSIQNFIDVRLGRYSKNHFLL